MGNEDTVDRIHKDVQLFTKNIKEIHSIKMDSGETEVMERARNYFEDTKYYLERGDLITSFGCITYAHGLLDSIRIIHKLI